MSDVFDDEIERLAEEYGDRDVAREIAEADHDLLRFYLPTGSAMGRRQWPRQVMNGRRTTKDEARGQEISASI